MNSLRKMFLPIGFSVTNDKYTSKYKHIDLALLNDKFYMQNLFNGSLISNMVCPIIYDVVPDLSNINYYRSLDYYQNYNSFDTLTDKERLIYFVGLRDLVFAVAELTVEINIDNIISNNTLSDYDIIIENVRISPFPSKSNSIVQWLDIRDQLPNLIVDYYIINNGLIMCFVNMYDLSYRNFENIIDFNSYFANVNLNNNYDRFESPDTDVYRFRIDQSFLQLTEISNLNFLTTPLNSNDRGGKRLIFHSEKLASVLTSVIDKIELPDLKKNFSHVNDVFRYNQFVPSDHKFVSHFDTPYVNTKKRLISKYTLIIYLTGEIDPTNYPLTIKNIKYRINELDAIIFSQKSEHEGKPFMTNNKIFIRTELIYHDDETIFCNKTAELFNKSCYYVKQSFFNPTIKEYINDMFNTVTKMRYKLPCETKNYQVFMKKYTDSEYVTNGHYYWVKLSNFESIKDFAMIILLDYFMQVPGKTISIDDTDDISIFSLIGKYFDKNVCNYLPNEYIDNFDAEKHIKKFDNSYEHFCNLCRYEQVFNELRNSEVATCLLDNIVINTNLFCDEYSLVISGEKIHINKDDIKIGNGIIYFKDTGLQNEIIFASCQSHNEVYLNIDIEMTDAKIYNLPPIYFKEFSSGCYKFNIDIFNNGAIYDSAYLNTTNRY